MKRENLRDWLKWRTIQRDKIRRMIFGDEQVDKWDKILREHFKGKSYDLIIEDDILET